MRKRTQKYLSAAFVFVLGAATAAGSREYHIGTLAEMGAGYFPMALGCLLAAIGILIAVTPEPLEQMPEADANQAPREPLRATLLRHLRPWLATLAGFIAFIVLGKYGGLVPATFALIFISALGDKNNALKDCFWLAVGVVVFAVLAFHYGLHMQFALFTWP